MKRPDSPAAQLAMAYVSWKRVSNCQQGGADFDRAEGLCLSGDIPVICPQPELSQSPHACVTLARQRRVAVVKLKPGQLKYRCAEKVRPI